MNLAASTLGLLAASCGTSFGKGSGGLLHQGHVDCIMQYVNGEWIMGYRQDLGSNPLDPNAPALGPLLAVKDTVLAARDQLFATGSRVLRPAGANWDFTGVAAHAPLWWFPQTNWPQGNYVGFVMTGPFIRYQETDPRLEGSGPEAWGRVNVESKRYRGKGDGHFSMWTNSTTSGLKVWVESRDGFQPMDRYFVGGNGHGHPAMAYSSLGLYEINYQGRAWVNPQQPTEVVSPIFSSYVAVGTYALWMAEHFSPQRWFTNEVSGDLADPDGDGIPNLMEYACGLNPRTADAHRETNGSDPGMPRVTLTENGSLLVTTVQRAVPENSQLVYRWETAAHPDSSVWSELVPLTTGPADEGWESVVYVMPAATPEQPRRFGRLRVELVESIAYP